jgi:hypothetical protein
MKKHILHAFYKNGLPLLTCNKTNHQFCNATFLIAFCEFEFVCGGRKSRYNIGKTIILITIITIAPELPEKTTDKL